MTGGMDGGWVELSVTVKHRCLGFGLVSLTTLTVTEAHLFGCFRQHQMTILEIIVVVLHCQKDGVLACVRSCMTSSDIWAPRYRKVDESAIDIVILRNRYDDYSQSIQDIGR